MSHENIVKLIDVFEIDHDSFATVLELCEGEDLDMRLKRNGKLQEREARSILIQVMRGLLYLNVGNIIGNDIQSNNKSNQLSTVSKTPKIIHYGKLFH